MAFALDYVLPMGIRRVQQDAPKYEALGFDGLWTTESQSDPFVDLTAAALNSERATLGTNVAIAFARSPFTTAMVAYELQSASGGRFICGLGTQVKGHITRRFGMPWESPGPKLREYVQAMRAIWTGWQEGKSPDFRGKFYTHTISTPFFAHPPIDVPPPEIWIAAVNEYNAETVGVCCDGLLVHPVHSTRYLDEVLFPAIDKGLAKSGRARSDIKLQCPVFLVVGKTPEEREQGAGFVRAQIGFYGSTRTYRRIFETHGWEGTPGRLHAKMASGDIAGMADEITDEMLEEFAITGDPDDVVDKVKARYGGVADRIYFYNLFASPFSDEGRLRELVNALAA